MASILPYSSFHFPFEFDENQGFNRVSPFASRGTSGLWCLPVPEVHPKQGQSGSKHLRPSSICTVQKMSEHSMMTSARLIHS